jgi:hypothetical protein
VIGVPGVVELLLLDPPQAAAKTTTNNDSRASQAFLKFIPPTGTSVNVRQ